jgi:Rieske Fe-S protein
MSHNDQERFEDYLEVERYIEDLRAGHRAALPENLSPEQASTYRMAALLRSALPENAAPRPEFVEALYATLQEKLQQQPQAPIQEIEEPEPPQQEELPGAPEVPPQALPRTRPRVSRRNLLTGGAVAAASLALGTVAGAAFERTHADEQKPPTTDTGWQTPLVGSTTPTRWLRTIALDLLSEDAHAFQTESIVGYVMRSDEDPAQPGAVIALSAACTHMGCIVHWQKQDRNFHCPCHEGLFNEYGQPAKKSPLLYLRALPRLKTRVGEDGYIYVEVPALVPRSTI